MSTAAFDPSKPVAHRIKSSERYSTPRAAELLKLSPDQFRRLASGRIEPIGWYTNPHYKSGPACPLWLGIDVRKLKRLAKARAVDDATRAKRRAAARKAVATKQHELLSWAETVEIVIPGSLQLTGDDRRDVNRIRHEHTRYERLLASMRGSVGKDEAYFEIKRGVLESIALVYPSLAEECEYQIAASHQRQMELLVWKD